MRASSAISTGAESPMGEPLATLPPIVPAWRTGGDAKRSHSSVSGGQCCASAPQAASSDAAAPMCSAPSAGSMRCSSGTRPMSISSGSSRSCLLTHRPMSVAPASTRAWGRVARSVAKSASERGAQ
jgi:hypothetical protein